MAIDPFLIVMPLVVLVIVMFFNFRIVAYYMDPMDKHMAYFQKVHGQACG